MTRPPDVPPLGRAGLPDLTDLHLDLVAMLMSPDDEVAETDVDAIIDALVSAPGTPWLARVVVTSGVSPESTARLVARFGAGFEAREPDDGA